MSAPSCVTDWLCLPDAHLRFGECVMTEDSLILQLLADAWERGYAAGVRHVPAQWTPNPFLCDEAVYISGALSPCSRITGHEGDHQYAFETPPNEEER